MKALTLGVMMLVAAGTLAWFVLAPHGLQKRPDISLPAVDGRQLKLSDYHGRPLLVTFWATTCRSCMEEIPRLIRLYQELAPRGLGMIAIAMSYDPPDRVLAVRNERRLPYPVALDIHADAARAFGNVELTPTMFLFAPDGRLVYRRTGIPDMNRLQQDILGLLGRADNDTRCGNQQTGTAACSG